MSEVTVTDLGDSGAGTMTESSPGCGFAVPAGLRHVLEMVFRNEDSSVPFAFRPSSLLGNSEEVFLCMEILVNIWLRLGSLHCFFSSWRHVRHSGSPGARMNRCEANGDAKSSRS